MSLRLRWDRVARRLSVPWRRRADSWRSTYAPREQRHEHLRTIFSTPPIDSTTPVAETLADFAGRHLEHRFDLLGSGWVRLRLGLEATGLEGIRFPPEDPVEPDPGGRWLAGRVNAANLADARRIWRLVARDYVPIDWQIDLRSGYRWREDVWGRDVAVTPARGADVKSPWELGRMQHLPRLALAHALARGGIEGFGAPETYVREIRDQILEFMASNPPRFGVQWRSTMDVAFRLVSWLVTRDLLLGGGAVLDDGFERELAGSVLDHGRHVRSHLEWSPRFGGNHYLANLLGLIFAGAYRPAGPEADGWLSFAVPELVREVGLQFGRDGGNFEGSTGYHRLSTEMLLWTTAVLLRLPGERWSAIPVERDATPGLLLGRLRDAADLVTGIARPDGRVPQIGDHDSGRVVMIDPVRDGDPLDHRGLVAAIRHLLGEEDPIAGPDAFVLATPGRQGMGALPAPAESVETVGDDDSWSAVDDRVSACSPEGRRTLRILAPGDDLRESLTCRCWPEFGLCLLRSPRLCLAIRCGPLGRGRRSGHAHNDQLAIELTVDGVDRIVERGTYVYTPLPERRDAYRSVRAHFAPRLEDGREPVPLGPGPFELGPDPEGTVLYLGRHGFAGMHAGYGAPMIRRLTLEAQALVVEDVYEGDGAVAPQLPSGAAEVTLAEVEAWTDLPRSPAYGVLESRDAD